MRLLCDELLCAKLIGASSTSVSWGFPWCTRVRGVNLLAIREAPVGLNPGQAVPVKAPNLARRRAVPGRAQVEV